MKFHVSDGIEFVERTSKSLESLMDQYRSLDVQGQHGLEEESNTLQVDYTFYVEEAAQLKKVGTLSICTLADHDPIGTFDEELEMYESHDSLETLAL